MKKILTVFLVLTIILISSCKEDDKILPVASFFFSPSDAGAGDTIYFKNNSLYANTLDWDFGDGHTSTEENPFHTYSEEGNYTVQLTAYNDDGSDMTSKSLSIKHSCWKKLANLPTPRHIHMATIVNNKIYVAGGATTWNEFEAYDISTNTWAAKADMPTIDREYLAGCAVNGKIYVIGGYYGLDDIGTTDILEEYDPATDSWNTKSPMPTKRWGHAAFPVNGKIYVIGGALDWPITKYYKTIEIYDPASDSWTTLTEQGGTSLTDRWGFGACMANDKIYVMGGIDVDDYPPSGENVPGMRIVEVYDPALNVWAKKASMPTARLLLASVTVNNKIYAIGGAAEYRPKNFTAIVEEYDPVTDTWVNNATLPEGLVAPAACELDNIIYIPGGGGLTIYDAYNTFYSYDPACDTQSK